MKVLRLPSNSFHEQFFFISLFILIPAIASAQLVNIEAKRMQTDSVRFALNGDFSFNHTNNDGNQVNQIDAAITTQLNVIHNSLFPF